MPKWTWITRRLPGNVALGVPPRPEPSVRGFGLRAEELGLPTVLVAEGESTGGEIEVPGMVTDDARQMMMPVTSNNKHIGMMSPPIM